MESRNDGMTPGSGQNAAAFSQQANAALDADRYEEAVALYGRAVELDPTRVNNWINQGLALWYLHRHAEALACYDRASCWIRTRPSRG